MRTRRVPGSYIPGPTAPLPLEDRQEADLYTAYRASGLRSWGRRYEDALRDPALAICLRNLATAIAIGQGSAACGASPAPTGCASSGTNNERTDK